MRHGFRENLSCLAAAAILAVAVGGCSTGATPTPAAAGRNEPKAVVPSTNVGRIQAFKDAELIASLDQGRSSAVGAGESMQPIYGDNTMLVINKIAYEDLAAGMTIAYVNRRGRRVVHQLIARDTLGWRLQGLNNEVEDRERVTRENLLGVVYASFAAGLEP